MVQVSVIEPESESPKRVIVYPGTVADDMSMIGTPEKEQAMTLRENLNQMSDREAVAYWNILQFEARMIAGTQECADRRDRHESAIDSILNERGIAHEKDCLTGGGQA